MKLIVFLYFLNSFLTGPGMATFAELLKDKAFERLFLNAMMGFGIGLFVFGLSLIRINPVKS